MERVTVTLPAEVVRNIDQVERNRSRFVLEAVQRELQRRQREELRRSLENPHPQTAELEEVGLDAWTETLPHEDVAELLDPQAGQPVQWQPGRGWIETKR
ncbi:MAG: hypothetical protein ABR599_07885 [Gemmatimonadota bacterium]